MSHLPELPQRLHHYAFVIRDHEVNRHFFEDVLGLPLVAKTFDEIDRRLAAAAIPRRQTDHGYCVSLYATSPDGLRVEFTVDPPNVDDINALRRADAHAELERWLAGDHAVNNLERAH
jgi:catechol 2,3-dioxygenase-like lactoylglutathione lyase family enzyme